MIPSLIAQSPLLVQLHLACALMALLVGAIQLLAPPGTPFHRARGALWVVLMATVCLGSFGLHTLNPGGILGGFTPIHLLSIFVLLMLARSLRALWQGQGERHGIIMRRTYIGGLIIAGAFTLVPGRLLYRVLFGA